MLVALVIVAFLDSPSNDKFQFWYAGHLVATGRSPYDTAAWSDASRYGHVAELVAANCKDPASASCRWIYVPWTAWLYAPLGLLDPALGMLVASAVLLVASAVALVLLSREAGLRGPQVVVFTVAAAVCAPYVWNTFLGHFGALELLGVALVAAGLRLLRARSLVAGGALLSLKPHLFLLAIPAFIAWLYTLRAWRVLLTTSVSLGLLAVVGVVSDAGFLTALSNAGSKVGGLVLPTTWALAPLPIATALVAAAGAAATAIVRRAGDVYIPVTAIIAFSLVAAPYIHLYDHVMLIPLVAAALSLAQRAPDARRYIGWAIAAAFVLVEWSAFLLGPHGDEPAGTALIPIALLVAVAVVARLSPDVQGEE